jgi:dipeptidyl aminopeptidase/acylaminoacyl peptidase
MSETRSLVERAMERVELRSFTLDGFHDRRERKRRDQRITAGVVGIAIFVAAVWIVTTGGPFDRSQPAVTGSTVPPAPGVPEVDYVIDLDTGVMTPLPEAFVRSLGGPLFEHQFAVSPDGSLLAFVGTDEEEVQIFIAGIDGTGVRQVTHEPNGAWSPAWSPDGTRIAYEGLDSGHVLGLYVLDVDSGESTQIAGVILAYVRAGDKGPMPALPPEPHFTPDGSSLVYTGGSDGHPVIRTVPVVGGTSSLLIGPGGDLRDAENGSLSPDGSLVTFLGTQIGRQEPQRWVADADGSERRLLPDVYGITCRSNPAGTWSPDGSRIVCAEASRVIVVDIATGVASPVAVGRGAIWLDDDNLLVSL